jgi:hypothetical protein
MNYREENNMRYAIVIDVDEDKAKELMEDNQLPSVREVILQAIDWVKPLELESAIEVDPNYRHIEPVANLVWTSDDVIGAMGDMNIEIDEWNINRALKAVENSNLAVAQGHVNAEISNIIEEEFEEE